MDATHITVKLIERKIETDQAFIDPEKAFDKLWRSLVKNSLKNRNTEKHNQSLFFK